MISLCMIVKNEIKYIEKCLESVKPYVDEMIVVDTGSTDGTLEVLEKYGCKIYHFEWCNDYSKARNFSISKAKYNWILVLDADEEVIEFNVEEVNRLIHSNYGEIRGFIKNRSFLGDLTSIRVASLPRFFHKKYYKYFRDIHEDLLPKYNFNRQDAQLPITVNHFGYLSSTREEKGKNEKYLDDLKRSLDNKYDPYLQKHLATTYLNMHMYDEAVVEIDKVLDDERLVKAFYFSEAVITKIKALSGLLRFDEALEMQKYFNHCQHDDEFLYCMAHIFFKNKNSETALDIYTYLFNKKELTVSRLEVIYGLGIINYENDNFKEALKWFEMLNITEGVKRKIAICKLKIADEKN